MSSPRPSPNYAVTETISTTARAHLRWALTDGVGPLLFTRLLEQFGSAEKALGASAGLLAELPRVGRVSAEKIARGRDTVDVDAEIERAAVCGVRILCQADEAYPPGLRRIPDPPIVVYIKGELRPADAVAVAVVGSRRCTVYGSEQARRFGELLAGAGFTVVSGLARGVDAFAHHGAIAAGGRTLAVLGSGLREIYPPENRALAEKLLDHGAWVSELPMSTAVRAQNFPSRNRLIAGMTLGTLVVEAAHRSGALITARLASDYNREVFAIPGLVSEPMAFGTNTLIRDGGAKLVCCLDDVLDELGDVGSLLGDGRPRSTPPRPGRGGPVEPPDDPVPLPGLSDAEERIYAVIPRMPTLQDVVLSESGMDAGQVLAALTALELKGLIQRMPGQMVRRVDRGG